MVGLRNLGLLGILLGVALCAQADNIQCEQGKNRIDHLICGDKALLSADFALADAYRATVDAAADQRAVIQSQRAWLKQRDACADAACIAQAYRARTVQLQQVKRAGWTTYRDPALGISFEYLANRKVKKPCPALGETYCVAIMGREQADTHSDYLIAFEIVNGALEQVADKDALFQKQADGRWMTTAGPGTPVEVERFGGNGWQGMRATVPCGISDEAGFHAGGGDCYWAVLSNGKRSVVVNTQGIVGTDAATMHSVETFRFER